MSTRPFRIGFVLFEQLTQLDLMGPLQVLSRLPDSEIHCAAGTLAPVGTDCGISLNPTVRFDDCPPLDLLCVPGGYGINDAMRDEVLIDFVRTRAQSARYVSSVCTGAFILGIAGLLHGRRATTHWRYHDALTRVGAKPVRARTVRDGSIVTGGGVTAGIDFAFALAEEIAGREIAARIQLGLEYDPAPPEIGGTPGRAADSVVNDLEHTIAGKMGAFDDALERALRAR